MAINKIIKDGTVLIDLSEDTVTSASDIVSGKVGHLQDGTRVTGTYEPTLITKTVTANGTYNASADNADGYSQFTVAIPIYDGTVV